MNRSNIIKLLVFSLVIFVLTSFTFYAESNAQSFKLVTDVLDGFGGRASSTNYSERVSTGGQPSAVNKMAGTNFKCGSGYAHSAWVRHGDVNGDGSINLGDVIDLAAYCFGFGPPPRPMEAGDFDCDNVINLADAINVAYYILGGGPPPCNL